jgi:type VI secretion system protein ImpE
MNASELFRAGKLGDAIAALNEQLKAAPGDAEARTLLFETLCFTGNLDRAEKQLDVLAGQSPDAEWPAQIYKNLLAGERMRRRVLAGQQAPEFLLDPPAYIQPRLQALAALGQGDAARAADLIVQSNEARPLLEAEVDGQACADFCDCDDLLSPVLEFMVLREYAWVPWEQIRSLEISAPERPRDLCWIPIQFQLVDDSQRRGYMPVLYCGSHEHDEAVQLGRMTDWVGGDSGPVRGLGQRMFLAGDEGRAALDTRRVTILHASQ